LSQITASGRAVNAGRPSAKGTEKDNRKVIFASGGICNGYQAQEVLEAGADIAMVYTAMTYGGVGTIARMKGEMMEARGKRV
jgi:dihydroorotate dehydrogenase